MRWMSVDVRKTYVAAVPCPCGARSVTAPSSPGSCSSPTCSSSSRRSPERSASTPSPTGTSTRRILRGPASAGSGRSTTRRRSPAVRAVRIARMAVVPVAVAGAAVRQHRVARRTRRPGPVDPRLPAGGPRALPRQHPPVDRGGHRARLPLSVDLGVRAADQGHARRRAAVVRASAASGARSGSRSA